MAWSWQLFSACCGQADWYELSSCLPVGLVASQLHAHDACMLAREAAEAGAEAPNMQSSQCTALPRLGKTALAALTRPARQKTCS